MKIVVIVNEMPDDFNLIKGGLHSVVRNLLEGLSFYNEMVYLISLNENANNTYIKKIYDNIIFIRLSVKFSSINKIDYFLLGRKKTKILLDKIKPDIIHLQGGSSFLSFIPIKYRKKSLYTEHGIIKEEIKNSTNLRQKLSLFLDYTLEKILRLNSIIYISNYNKNINKHKFKNSELIYNPVNNVFFDIKPQYKTNNNLVYVGAINERKNILLLLQSMNKLILNNKKYHLHIIGDFTDNKYKKKINDYINKCNLKEYLFFHGWCEVSEIITIFKKSNILVLPSNQETLPVSIIEAQSSGLIPIATDVGGVSELINDSLNGFIFEKGDNNRLYEILYTLYNNNELISTLSFNTQKIAKCNFTSKEIANKTINFYKKIIKNFNS